MPRHIPDQLFAPGSVALIGASEREGSVGAVLAGNLLNGFKGEVYPVNPRHSRVMGAKCFPSVEDLPGVPDLAVIATPAKTVVNLVDACGRKGVKAAVIISAGFGEAGSEGREAGTRLEEAQRAHGLRIVGPNCLGLIRPGQNLNLTFLREAPPRGGLAFLSQSGAMGSASEMASRTDGSRSSS
jgi:acetyltransferase